MIEAGCDPQNGEKTPFVEGGWQKGEIHAMRDPKRDGKRQVDNQENVVQQDIDIVDLDRWQFLASFAGKEMTEGHFIQQTLQRVGSL